MTILNKYNNIHQFSRFKYITRIRLNYTALGGKLNRVINIFYAQFRFDMFDANEKIIIHETEL